MAEEVFSSIDFVGQCLIDRERTSAFEAAVRAVVKPGATVLDVGTGSGIMALYAAKHGARKVYAVEIDPYIAGIAQRNAQRNGFQDRIRVVNADARTVSLSDSEDIPFDVVIMEMLTSGMVDEHQVQAVNRLHECGYVHENTLWIPGVQETFLQFAHTVFDRGDGLDVRMPIHAWRWCGDDALSLRFLTAPYGISSIDFSKKNSESISVEVRDRVQEEGVVNSVVITSKTYLAPGVIVGDTISLNGPVIIPLEYERAVAKGQTITAGVSYAFGMGYGNFSVAPFSVA